MVANVKRIFGYLTNGLAPWVWWPCYVNDLPGGQIIEANLGVDKIFCIKLIYLYFDVFYTKLVVCNRNGTVMFKYVLYWCIVHYFSIFYDKTKCILAKISFIRSAMWLRWTGQTIHQQFFLLYLSFFHLFST